MNYSSAEIPQANRVDLLFHVIRSAGPDECTVAELTNTLCEASHGTFVARQGAYYADACVALGLLVRGDVGYHLTKYGRGLLVAIEVDGGAKFMAQAILQTPVISELLRDFGGSERKLPSLSQIAVWLTGHSDLSFTTAKRRASTIRKYVSFAWEHQ